MTLNNIILLNVTQFIYSIFFIRSADGNFVVLNYEEQQQETTDMNETATETAQASLSLAIEPNITAKHISVSAIQKENDVPNSPNVENSMNKIEP